MKILSIFFVLICIKNLSTDEKHKLEALDKYLYQVEDKVDHLLYHHGHDVTRHEA